MYKIAVVSTVHYYKNARVYFKCLLSLRKKYKCIRYMVPHTKKSHFIENNIDIFPIPIPQNRFQRFIKNQYYIYRELKNWQPDIIHFHVPELILLMWYFKKNNGTKVVFDIHENVAISLLDKDWIPVAFRVPISKMYRFFEKLLTKSFDALIIAESSYKKTYGDNAIELLNYPVTEGQILKGKKEFSGNLNFVYVGNITRERGIFVILESYYLLKNKSKDITFTLIGSFAPLNLKDQVYSYIKEKNIEDSVRILGEQPLPKVFEELENMHFGFAILQPIGNYIESLSTKIFDYMTKGVPYIVSNFPIYNEYTIKTQTGITCSYGDINEMVEKISLLIENREQLSLMSANGISAVKNKWNWYSQETKLFELYSKLTSS